MRGALPLSLVEAIHPEPLEALSGLTDASLVQIRHGSVGSAVHLLQTVRRYVLAHHPLDPEHESALVERAADFVDRLGAEAVTPRSWAALQTLDRLRLTVPALVDLAIRREQPSAAARLALAMHPVYQAFGSEPAGSGDAPARRIGCRRGARLGPRASARRVAPDARQDRRGGASGCPVRRASPGSGFACRGRGRANADCCIGRENLDTRPLTVAIPDLPDGSSRWRGLSLLGLLHTRRMEVDVAIDMLKRSLAIADRLGVGWDAGKQLVAPRVGVLCGGGGGSCDRGGRTLRPDLRGKRLRAQPGRCASLFSSRPSAPVETSSVPSRCSAN